MGCPNKGRATGEGSVTGSLSVFAGGSPAVSPALPKSGFGAEFGKNYPKRTEEFRGVPLGRFQ